MTLAQLLDANLETLRSMNYWRLWEWAERHGVPAPYSGSTRGERRRAAEFRRLANDRGLAVSLDQTPVIMRCSEDGCGRHQRVKRWMIDPSASYYCDVHAYTGTGTHGIAIVSDQVGSFTAVRRVVADELDPEQLDSFISAKSSRET